MNDFTPYIGLKLPKPRPKYNDTEYVTTALWCRENKATIEDKETYYEVVAIPDPPLDEVKEAKIKELASCWNRDDEESITTTVGEFEADTLSRNRISAAINGMTDTDTREWTLKTGETVTVTKAQLQDVMDTWMVRCDLYHTKYLNLKARVDAATTIAEVRAIKWDDEE